VRRVGTALLGLWIVTVAAPAAADHAAALRATRAHLDVRQRSALYALYSSDSAITRARSAAAAASSRAQALARQAQVAREEAAVARHNLDLSRHDLMLRLRAWYKSGATVDPLELILTSRSLVDALSQDDAYQRITAQDQQVIDATRSAGQEYRAALARVTTARAEAQAEQRAAQAQVDQLVAQQQARRTLIAQLRQQQAGVSSRLAGLQATARLAAERTATVSAAAATPVSAPVPQPTGPAPSSGRQIVVSATAYSLPGHTSSGLPVGPGICAVDPSVIPMGTRFIVPGYGTCIAADRGTAIIGARIDLWFSTFAQAAAWGRQTVTITLL
jgi:3D (Asp-Asp-Asp) domain-containing protein